MSILEINNIDVYYGDAQALRELSLNVNEGEIVTIVGSNGAGKTTTLRTISGMLHPKKGTIEFLGERIDHLPPYKIVSKGVSHVPEGRGLFPHMTVLENLKMGAYNTEAWKKKDETIKWIEKMFPILEERKKQLAGTLSGGEQQMLAIGRGLMSLPQILLLDEPSLGLAPILVLKIFETIELLNKEGVTILLVEQNAHRALDIARRGYVIETGTITLSGDREGLLDNEYVKKAYLGR